MKWVKKNEEVFYPKKIDFVAIDKLDIDYLIKASQNSTRNRARYCTHSSPGDEVHEMIIFHKKGTYVRPHKHIGKTESFHLLDGEVDVLIFDEEGSLMKSENLGKYQSGKSFYYRIPESCYHTQIFKKDTVFHEVTMGPFDSNDSVKASWAPDEKETVLVKRYIDKITHSIKSINSRKRYTATS